MSYLSLYSRLLSRDKDTRLICGFSKDNMPGEDALGRFLKKLTKHITLFEECLKERVDHLRKLLPNFGEKLAVDSTDILAYSNGHREHPSDLDAHWGARRKVMRKLKGKRKEAEGKKESPKSRMFTIGLAINCT